MAHFIVGIDGSTSSADALRWSSHEAQIRDARLTAVLVWDLFHQYHLDGKERFDPEYSDADAASALDAIVERTLGEAGAGVGREVVCDLPAPGLLGASKEADLLVLGARGLGGFRGLLLGSVSQRCLDHAPCPVAIVRGDREMGTMGRVLVGVDGSEESKIALRWAIDEARHRSAILEVVHAWHMPYVGVYPYVGDAFDLGLVERAAKELVEEALSASDAAGMTVDRTIVQGTPTRTIIDAAKDADLIVVGARGLGGFGGLLLGSVSHQLARHADRPLVVVPSEA